MSKLQPHCYKVQTTSITVKPSVLQIYPTASRHFSTYGPHGSARLSGTDEPLEASEQPPVEKREQLEKQDEFREPVSQSTSKPPWYLQVKIPQRVENPLLERQRLPELPPDPPPLMQALLEHISIELGLDNLSLLDLRHLDAPPALGSRLMMVIGTARSEKHLHVSADRFCRWLRTTHQLTPRADGLLGRGQLRVKLRRRARRTRILSRVGSSDTTSRADEGLRTGWVCINVGIIEDGARHTNDSSKDQGYVGFSDNKEGAMIIVQMLTQEKREELQLEKLWKECIGPQARREEKVVQVQEELQETPEAEIGAA
ncbi:MAG: hypothetical protein Q9191_007333 [Dirinaria sp. TL-2023a]